MKKPKHELTATIGERELRYTVTVSRTARKARLRVGPNGVEVVIPPSAPESRAAAFLTEQQDWVLSQLERVDKLGTIRNPPRQQEPETLLLGGERIALRVLVEDTARRFALVRRTAEGLTVIVPRREKVDAGKAIENWLRREARRVIEARVAAWAKVLKRTPNCIYIRGQKTKWGNCSKLRNLSFNWRLVMAPERTLDAIVIHELAHLIEPTHETRFWLLVRSHCSDYDARVRWLTTNQTTLYAVLDRAISA